MPTPPDREPTRRFADRVDDYVRYRPGYPPGLIDLMRSDVGLESGANVADIGSGTGKLTELLLPHASAVFAVEPNREMREAAERLLGGRPGFRSVAGSAEATGLEPGSIDLVVAAQAFHWFRRNEARAEFARISRTGGRTALIWNRRTESTAFLREYEALLQREAGDYAKIDHRKTTDSGALVDFFGGSGPRRAMFPNFQQLDWNGLRGRALSSSYFPGPGQARHDDAIGELRQIYDRHSVDDRVTIEYETEIFWGRVARPLDCS